MRVRLLLCQLAVVLPAFIAGCGLTLYVLLRLLAPGPGCEAPCDGPVYVAIGLALVAGPVAGVGFAVAGVALLSKRWRRHTDAVQKKKTPGRPERRQR